MCFVDDLKDEDKNGSKNRQEDKLDNNLDTVVFFKCLWLVGFVLVEAVELTRKIEDEC